MYVEIHFGNIFIPIVSVVWPLEELLSIFPTAAAAK